MARPALKRLAVAYVCGHYTLSWRRACRLVRLPRSGFYYRSVKDPKLALRGRMPRSLERACASATAGST